MTIAESRKKVKMMKTGVFQQVLYDCIQWLHEERLSEPPASVEEYVAVVGEAVDVLTTSYSSVLPKKVVKWKQKTLEQEIEDSYKGNVKERFNDIANGRE